MPRRQRRDVGFTAGAGREGNSIPPAVKAAAAEAKKVVKAEKKIQQAERSISIPAALSANKEELKAIARAEILAYIHSKTPAQPKLPRAIKDYVRCLIDPNGATETRIPDGKSRVSSVASSYNVFPVFGNWDTLTDPADYGRFCWCFTPVPLNFGWYTTQDSHLAINFDINTGTPTSDGTYTCQQAGLCSFAAEMNPEDGWDPINSFYFDSVPELTDSMKTKFLKHSPEMLSYVESHKHLRNKKPTEVERHMKLQKTIDKCTQKLTSSKTGQAEKDRLVKEYAAAKDAMDRIEVSPALRSKWNHYMDQDSAFLTGSGSVGSNDVIPTVTWDNEYTGGNARTLRPVAQSVWFECVTTEFSDAGSVSITYLPCKGLMGNVVPTNILAAGPAPNWNRKGPLENWEQHTTLPLQNTGSNRGPATTYCGKFKEGAYAYWLPEDPTDYEFLSPSEMCFKGYPVIIVSGQNGAQAGTGTDPGVIANIHVNTVYEFETDEPNLSPQSGLNYPGALEEVALLMKNLPQCMSNDSHKKWWQIVLKALGTAALGFATGGIGAAAAAAGGYLVAEL
jgi:hypothetical protein